MSNEWSLREYVFLLFLYSSNLLWKEVPPNFRPTVFSSFELLMQVLCNDKAELFSLYIFPRHSGSRKKRENQNCVICLKFGCTYHWGEQDWTRSPLCSAHDRQQKTVFDQAAMQGNLAVDAVLHISCCRNRSLLRTAGYGSTPSLPFPGTEQPKERPLRHTKFQTQIRSTNFGRRLSKLFFTTSRTCHPNIQCCCCHSYSPFHELVGFLYANGLWIMLNGAHKQYTRGVRDVCVYYLVLSEDY